MIRELHQFLPTFAGYDAIGSHAIRLRCVLREAGFRSMIFAADVHTEMRRQAHDYSSYEARVGDGAWLLYHASTASPMAGFLADEGRPLLLDYHNITDASFFERWSPVIAGEMIKARAELRGLLPATRGAMADSPFNEAELCHLGFSPTAVVPILVDFREYDVAPDRGVLRRRLRARARGGADWLFVGRVSPNKCVHDVIGAFAVYRSACDNRARLTLVGGRTADDYWSAVKRLIVELGLTHAVRMVDKLPMPQLAAIYRTSDLFVLLSEHEGFNVPVLEAMHFGVPVVAYASSAVPGTVADAGILLDDKDPLLVAAAADRVIRDGALRSQLQKAGHARVQHFSLANTRRRALEVIEAFMVDAA